MQVHNALDEDELHEFFDEALPALETLDASMAFKLLAKKLAYSTNLGDSVEESGVYPGSSKRWCARLDRSDSSPSEDVRAQFARRLTSVAVRIASAGPEECEFVAATLQAQTHEIFTRIYLHVLAEAGQHVRKRLDALIASELVVEPPFRFREVALVLRNRFADASPEAQGVFCYGVEHGPSVDYVSRLVGVGGDEPKDAESIEDIVSEWQRRRLRWFQDRLPPKLRELANRLNVEPQKLSTQEQALAEDGFWVGGGGFVRHLSPKSGADLAAMSAVEMITFLQEWTPDERSIRRNAPNVEGLQNAVTAYVAADPGSAVERASLALEAQVAPWYLQAFLAGFQKADTEAPWSAILAFARDVLRAAAASAQTEPVDAATAGEQQGWRWAAIEAVDLVRNAAAQRHGPASDEGVLWDAMKAAFDATAFWADDRDAAAVAKSFGDVLGDALNRFSGRSTNALFAVARWAFDKHRAEGKANESGTQEPPNLLTPFLEQILEGEPRSSAAEAVIGEHVPELWFFARSWLHEWLPRMFSDGARDPLRHAAWGGYLTAGRDIYLDIFDELRPWYLESAKYARDDAENDDSWALPRHLLSHLTLLIEFGRVAPGDPDNLLELAYENTPLKHRLHSYWEIFRRWSDRAEKPAVDAVRRITDFWRWRLDILESQQQSPAREEEIQALGWLFCTPHLLDDDALTLGLRTVKIAGGELEVRGQSWERLLQLASVDAAMALEIAEAIALATLSHQHPYLPFKRVGPVLKKMLGAADPTVRQRAERLVHKIGERLGRDEFRSLLEGS